jgi:hypothetical protein
VYIGVAGLIVRMDGEWGSREVTGRQTGRREIEIKRKT